MRGFIDDIEGRTGKNRDFRQVVYTGPNLQLVLMALGPGEDIGDEVHEDTDQFFRLEEGKGEAWINGHVTSLESGMAVLIPAGTRHNIRNTGQQPMRMYTLYAPPHHEDGTVHHTKADAELATEHFTGKTTE